MTRIHISPPHMGDEERALLLEAFDSNWIAPLGPQVDAFEREICEYVGCGHATALSSGTAALHLALVMLGVGRDDRVIVPTLTFAATANAVVYCGAEPVFVDSSRETWTVDPELLSDELELQARHGRLPRAVVVVDLYGQCADHEKISAACQRYGVPVVEDAAEALGATYGKRRAGTFGEMGVFSFNGNKIVSTSSGGMLVSDRMEWADRAKFLASQARDPAVHYEHSVIGYNYRMSNLLAAVGRGQLRWLDKRIEARRAVFERYRGALGATLGIEFMPEAGYGRSTRWLTALTVDRRSFGVTRNDILDNLERLDIEARPVWKPMHLQPVFRGCRVVGGSVSEDLFERGLCLPSGSAMTEQDCDRVVAGILEVAG